MNPSTATPYASAMSRLAGDAASENLDQRGTPATPTAVVERFLELLAAADLEGALQLVAADVEYENVSLPTVHGRERMRRLFSARTSAAEGSRSTCTPSRLMARLC
jgi:hypothetical protein